LNLVAAALAETADPDPMGRTVSAVVVVAQTDLSAEE